MIPNALKSKANDMGRVVVRAKIENLGDLYAIHRKLIPSSELRAIETENALIDTGATSLGMPQRLIKQLGLSQTGIRPVNTTKGVRQAKLYEAVRLTVQGRDCVVDVTDVAGSCPVLIGQVPLELMDFVVDPRGQQLIGNPAHGGQQMYDLY